MPLARPSLHAPVTTSADHLTFVRNELLSIASRQEGTTEAVEPTSGIIEISLSTVSLNSNFDANISIRFEGALTPVDLLVDSGNSVLVVPYWEQLQPLAAYELLVAGSTEPFGCPANVVRGPLLIPTTSGGIYRIASCVFYACTADAPSGDGRTANFGTGCLSPWNETVPGVTGPLQAPLSYNQSYPYAEFNYEADSTLTAASLPKVMARSYLRLYQEKPAGYRMFKILPNLEWMSLVVKDLRIEGTKVIWPETVTPIAMIDTGGGPVFLSQPNGYVFGKPWPDGVTNPDWTAQSVGCESTDGVITLELGDTDESFTYSINPAQLPDAGRGLTLVMCQVNSYMMGQQGINIGGISALVNDILVDYKDLQVGLKAK